MGKKRRSFSKDFKLEAVKLVKEGGLSAGRAAKDLGIYETSLRRWIKQYEIDHGEGPAGALTTYYTDEASWLAAVSGTVQILNTTASGVALADEVTAPPVTWNAGA